jgi:hypothetical protein
MNQELLNWCMTKPLYKRSDDELLAFVSMPPVDDCDLYRTFRVQAYVFLLAGMGDGRTELPYLVWSVVMGDIPPPTTCGRGMFPLFPDPKHFYNWN